MPPILVALTSRTSKVRNAELNRVAAALQKQVTRDFAPLWNIDATVSAFAPGEVPLGYWTISIQDQSLPDNAEGLHKHKADNSPYALVRYGPTWSLTASHELLEMLADPSGDRLVAGLSPKPGQGRVQFLLEVCDPCQDIAFAYEIDGVNVSDFYTPHYFDPDRSAGARYSRQGTITEPRQVLPNGYLSWLTVEEDWFKASADAQGRITFVDGGPNANRTSMTLREHVDSLAPGNQHHLSNAVAPGARRSKRLARASGTAAARLDCELKDRWNV